MRIILKYDFSNTQCRLGRDLITINEPRFIYEVDCDDAIVKYSSEYELKKMFEQEAREHAAIKYLNELNEFLYKR